MVEMAYFAKRNIFYNIDDITNHGTCLEEGEKGKR